MAKPTVDPLSSPYLCPFQLPYYFPRNEILNDLPGQGLNINTGDEISSRTRLYARWKPFLSRKKDLSVFPEIKLGNCGSRRGEHPFGVDVSANIQ